MYLSSTECPQGQIAEGDKDEKETLFCTIENKEKSKDRRGQGLTGTEVNEGGYWDGSPSLVPGYSFWIRSFGPEESLIWLNINHSSV